MELTLVVKDNYNQLLNYCKSSHVYKNAPPKYDLTVRILRAAAFLAATSVVAACSPMSRVYFIPLMLFSYVTVFQQIIPIFREWRLQELTQDQSKEKVVLYCRAKSDYSGAATTLSNQHMKALTELSKTHSIVFVRAGDIDTINRAMASIKKNQPVVTTLWISCHASPLSMELDAKSIGVDGTTKFNFSNLGRDADIVLDMCSAGKPFNNRLNIAQMIQLQAGPNRKVHCATSTLPWNGTSCIVNEGSKNKWSFKSLLGFNITADISYKDAFATYFETTKPARIRCNSSRSRQFDS